MTQVDNERPPYVTFERVPVEDRNASIAAGRYVAKDVDFVTITRPGSRDNVVKMADEYKQELRRRAGEGLIPSTWPELYEAAYRRWLEGEEVPAMGTPIKGWPLVSPATQKSIIDAGIRTVEDLAVANEATIANIGPGAVSFKEKAKSWLASAESVGKVAEELTVLKQDLENARQTISLLQEQLKAAQGKTTSKEAPEKAPAF